MPTKALSGCAGRKVFWNGALGGTAHSALDSLEGRDLIRRDSVSRLQGQQQYTFKHQLIREVAYATLPRPSRRERHAATARFLEGAVTEVADVAPALAHHWREAGDSERAVRYYVAAAEQASRGWAKDVAASNYQQALALIPDEDSEQRRELMRRQAVALAAVYHMNELLARRGAGAPAEPSSAENRRE